MKKAILKTILFSLIILASCALINWVLIPNSPNAYQAAKLDKLRMLSTVPAPRILLVGGSNLAFSIDSDLLHETFGLPVVNMGLAKSVGLEYLLSETLPFIGPDDVVVLAFEYELFYDLFYGSDGLIVELQYVPSGFKHLHSLGQYKMFASKFGPIMQAKFTGYIRTGSASLTNEIYRRNGFNQYGDLVTHLDEPPSFEPRGLFEENTPFNADAVDVLNAFGAAVQAAGARVVLTAPPLVDVEYDAHRERIKAIYGLLAESLEFPIISDPDDYVFPLDAMYDTAYHLLREGRSQRTRQLIHDLETAGIIRSGEAM